MQNRTIGQVFKYVGDWHVGIRGHLVVVLRVHRNGVILERDEEVGDFDEKDIIEFAPLIDDGNGRLRRSFATSDARADHFERVTK